MYAENVNLLGKNLHSINKNTEVLFVSNKEKQLAVNVKWVNNNIEICNESFPKCDGSSCVWE